MATKTFSREGRTHTRSAKHRQEQGFVVVSMLALVPLVVTLVVCLCAALWSMRRQEAARSHCVRSAVQLQSRLKPTLDKLLRLNPRATSLRAQRTAADNAVTAAVASGYPPAIAAAKAIQVAVVLQQVALRAKQEALFLEANADRQMAENDLRSVIGRKLGTSVVARRFYWRALAVEARPPAALTPDYRPVPLFHILQQQRFEFALPLRGVTHAVACSATLQGRENAWRLKILAANPASNSRWW